MNIKTATYWATTVLFALALGAAGAADLLLVPDMAAAMQHLGYPDYFARILGAWKVLGVLALLAPAAAAAAAAASAFFFSRALRSRSLRLASRFSRSSSDSPEGPPLAVTGAALAAAVMAAAVADAVAAASCC